MDALDQAKRDLVASLTSQHNDIQEAQLAVLASAADEDEAFDLAVTARVQLIQVLADDLGQPGFFADLVPEQGGLDAIGREAIQRALHLLDVWQAADQPAVLEHLEACENRAQRVTMLGALNRVCLHALRLQAKNLGMTVDDLLLHLGQQLAFPD